MARKNLMPMPAKGSTAPKIVATLIIVALLVIVVKHPSEAAVWARAIVGWLGGVLDSFVSFASQL